MSIFYLKTVTSSVSHVPRRPVVKSRTKKYAWIYAITTIVFFLIDLIWIGVVASNFYAMTIGQMLRESVNWPAALIFYLIYIGGIVLFVLAPAIRSGSRIGHVALRGGLLGVFAYGTFDLTALALLEGWPVIVTIVDITWGTILTAGTASGALWISRTFLATEGLSGG
jgi:uncharacterized membrane protein